LVYDLKNKPRFTLKVSLWKHCYRFTFFSHSVTTCFRLSAVTVSLHHLPQMSAFNCHMRAKHLQLLKLNLWRFIAMLLLHNRDQR